MPLDLDRKSPPCLSHPPDTSPGCTLNLRSTDLSKSATVLLRQLNCTIWYCVFEHRARFSGNPGRNQLSPCPKAPSASVLGSLPLLLRNLRWDWCRFWMRMTKDTTFLSQKLRLAPQNLIVNENRHSVSVVTVSQDKTFFVFSVN